MDDGPVRREHEQSERKASATVHERQTVAITEILVTYPHQMGLLKEATQRTTSTRR